MELLSNHKKNFKDIYKLDQNKYNLTFTVFDIKIQKNVFLKVYDKKLIDKGPKDLLLKQIEREENISKLFDSKYIIKLINKFETDLSIIFEYELCQNNIFNYFKDNGKLMDKPKVFIKLVHSLANILEELKNKKVIHRDIKPYNILIQKINYESDDLIDNNNIIKLGDFGSSTLIEENDSIQIGTLLYTAPEIIKNIKYNEKCDMWSLGVTLYHLYFGFSPYGLNYNFDKIQEYIYSNNFIYKFSGNPILDILFKRLLTIEPENRMSHEEFKEYVFNKEFENSICKDIKTEFLDEIKIKYEKTYNEIEIIMNSKQYKELKIEELKEEESDEPKKKRKKQLKKIVQTLSSQQHVLDIMLSTNEESEDKKYINILYYNENLNHSSIINREIDAFEKETNGTFIFCNEEKSLKIILYEISRQIIYNNKKKFCLIVTGKTCEKVMKLINDNKYNKCFKYICIFCKDKQKYLSEKEKYNNIKEIFNSINNVIENFIKKYKSEDIEPFINKLITFEEYKNINDKYFKSHQKISEFYGDLTPESYKENLKKIKELINEDIKKKNFNNEKEKIVVESFMKFNINEDLKKLNEKIINEYTKNTFYGDLNRWLREINTFPYEEVAYFTSRLMFSLNQYASENSKFYNKNKKILYRGLILNYSTLLTYERAKGKIIIFTSFTSTSEIEEKASKKMKIYGNYEEKFSVMIKIINLYKSKWISNGIDIQEISEYPNEKEILYQPFSFYKVKDVEIKLDKKEAEIKLETIGKIEILEEKIKYSNYSIEYKEKENIVKLV